MITLPATPRDVDYVLGHLSDQHRSEHDAMGLSREEVAQTMERLMASGFVETMYLKGNPAFVFGVDKDEGTVTTWFIATHDYFNAGLPVIRHAKRYLKNIRARFGVNVIAVKRKIPSASKKSEEEIVNVSPKAEDTIKKGDILVVLGPNENIEKLKKKQ